MTDATEAALLPCPFCGPGHSIVECVLNDLAQRYQVICGRCGASSGISPRDKTPAPTIAAWNRRALLAGHDEVVERLPTALTVDGAYRERQGDYKVVATYSDPQDAEAVIRALKTGSKP